MYDAKKVVVWRGLKSVLRLYGLWCPRIGPKGNFLAFYRVSEGKRMH